MHQKSVLVVFLAVTVCSLVSSDSNAQFRQRVSRDEKVQQALNRLTFGARPGDVQHVKSVGLKKWIDLQLHPERIPENPQLEAKLRPLDTLTMSPAKLLQNYPSPREIKEMVAGRLPFPDDPDKRLMVDRLAAKLRNKTNPDGDLPRTAAPPGLRRRIVSAKGPQVVVAQDLIEAKLLRAVYSDRQLEEVLVDFWYNHFNVFLDKGADRYLVTAYERDAIRPHVLGKFEDLLRATAQSPAMLFYLDNWESAGPQSPAGKRGRGLNENYGRELLELHTLGVDGGYTQKDVTEVARCFTGWTIRQPRRAAEFEFNPRMHDDGEKTVLGARIPAGGGIQDGCQVLHLIAHHPSTARFISRELAVRFVADNPPESLVKRMAATFLKTDGDLRAVMQTMFDSPEFWSRGAYRSKMKSPLEMVASSLRALNAGVDFTFGLSNQLKDLGEPLYRKLEPVGYSNSSAEWLNSAGLLARMNFSVALANNKVPGVKVDQAASAEGLTLGSPDFQKK